MSDRLEIRMSPDLLERLDGARGEVPRGTFIKRALETALGGGQNAAETSDGSDPLPSVKSSPSVPASSRAFRCPIYTCTFEAASSAAVCGRHGRKVIPV